MASIRVIDLPGFRHFEDLLLLTSPSRGETTAVAPRALDPKAIRRDVESIIPPLASRRGEPPFISPYPKTSA
jgi:hypothetical protein